MGTTLSSVNRKTLYLGITYAGSSVALISFIVTTIVSFTDNAFGIQLNQFSPPVASLSQYIFSASLAGAVLGLLLTGISLSLYFWNQEKPQTTFATILAGGIVFILFGISINPTLHLALPVCKAWGAYMVVGGIFSVLSGTGLLIVQYKQEKQFHAYSSSSKQ